MRFRCACEVCPVCGKRQYRDDHPEDGLAYCYTGCRRAEWWAHVGPQPVRCARNKRELAAMKAYDDSILAANNPVVPNERME